jgi:hypothetical protein
MSEPSEPTTLRELYDRTRTDTDVMRWVFLHARIVGRLEVARTVLKRVEQRDWEACARASAFYPETTQHQAQLATRPTADLDRAQALVTELAAMEHAAGAVTELLKARAPATSRPVNGTVSRAR